MIMGDNFSTILHLFACRAQQPVSNYSVSRGTNNNMTALDKTNTRQRNKQHTSGSQKVPGILSHRRFSAPWVRAAWTECYWKRSDKWQAGTVVSAPSHTSPSHRTLRISLFPASRGHVSVDNAPSHTSPSHRTLRISLFPASQPWRVSNGMRGPNCGRFQQKPSAGASSSGRIHVASVYARKGPTVKVIS
jgi:hypothetical protein